MLKTGVVLFVKNEVEDIASWIAWHVHCGFSSIIIYDDYSTDGTWEVINEAAKTCDVRALRAIDADQFNIRQKRTYVDALERFREEFDWLLFLDSDEYLDIRDGSSVEEFLSNYPEANGVALNWCCFGSNRHVIKPPTPNVFENYIMRSEPDFEYNYTTKSFVRPKQTDPVYINPHRFQVNGPYVTTDHQPVSWKEEHPDRTTTLAQWDVARVHHYVIRSAQHYIEKMQRRVDIREAGIGIGLFNHCDRNDYHDFIPPERTDSMMARLHRIQQQVNLAFFNGAIEKQGSVAPQAGTGAALTARPQSRLSAHTFQTVHETTLCYEKSTGRLCHVKNPESDPRVAPLLAIAATLWPDMIFLTTPEMSQPLFTSHDPRVSTVLSFKLERCDDHRVGFRNPVTGLLTCFLLSDNLKETMAGNRSRLQEWEKLQMTPSLQPLPTRVSNLFRTLDHVSDPSSLYPVTDPYTTADIFAAAVSLQSQEDYALRRAAHRLSNVSWMQRHDPLSVQLELINEFPVNGIAENKGPVVTMKTAILFKCHSWDATIERSFNRCKSHAGRSDVFILYDNSRGFCEIPEHIVSVEKIFFAPYGDVEKIGFAWGSETTNLGGYWYNGDYHQNLFILKNPQYDYICSVENDVVILVDLDTIFDDMQERSIDAVYKHVDAPNMWWAHTSDCAPYYNLHEHIHKGLFCISFFSRDAALLIARRRLEMSYLKRQEGLTTWPIGEAVMAHELAMAGMKTEELAHYCDNLSHYDWAPCYLEKEISGFTQKTFVHPVTALNDKFISSNLAQDYRCLISDAQIKSGESLERASVINDLEIYARLYHHEKLSGLDDLKANVAEHAACLLSGLEGDLLGDLVVEGIFAAGEQTFRIDPETLIAQLEGVADAAPTVVAALPTYNRHINIYLEKDVQLRLGIPAAPCALCVSARDENIPDLVAIEATTRDGAVNTSASLSFALKKGELSFFVAPLPEGTSEIIMKLSSHVPFWLNHLRLIPLTDTLRSIGRA